MSFHEMLAAGRWQTFSLLEQLGNIGSEVNRALSWREKQDAEKSFTAMARGLELFDLTLDDPRWKNRRKELARAREVICDYFVGTNDYRSSPENLRSYFDAFAARMRK